MIKHESNKNRYKIVKLIRQSRRTYYQQHFEQNKKDSKTIWQGIYEITSSRKGQNQGSNVSAIIATNESITDPIEIAETFNYFFISISRSLRKKIPPTIKTFTDYLKNLIS